jgi:glycosyltransferase involved in cell wall biosynthesis
MSEAMVSVVIPLYNKSQWIEQTLMSVSNQTYSNWECIVVDDGSNDGSLEIVKKFAEENQGNWRVYSQVNSGQAVARNFGISMARGKYIAFLDADDIWMPSKLHKQVDYLSKNKEVDILFCSYVIFEESLKMSLRVVRFKDSRKMIVRWLQMLGFGGLIESVGLMKSEFLENQGAFSENLSTSSGLEISLRALINAKVMVLPDVLVSYRISDNQWHKDCDELAINCKILNSMYGGRILEESLIKSYQDAYFFWNGIRKKGRSGYLVSLAVSILKLDIPRIHMFLALLSRNIRSYLAGSFNSKALKQAILLSINKPAGR